jgi:hypothetical protein
MPKSSPILCSVSSSTVTWLEVPVNLSSGIGSYHAVDPAPTCNHQPSARELNAPTSVADVVLMASVFDRYARDPGVCANGVKVI